MVPLLPFLLLGLGFGLSSVETARFERAAAADIASRLSGDAVQVSVKIVPNGIAAAWGEVSSATISANNFSLDQLPLFTEPDRSQYGKLHRLRIQLSDFRLRGLLVSELTVDIRDCRFDLGLARSERKLRLTRSGEGLGTVKIAEDSLAEYIVEKYAEIKSATVRVYNDVIWVEGYGEFLFLKTDFAIIAHIVAVDGTKLTLTDAKIYFDWQRADPAAVQILLDILNPVIDLDADLGLFGAITVEHVRLRNGVLEASGPARIPIKPSAGCTDNSS